MSKHTPEPWTFESEPQYCSEIFGSDGMSVCTFVDDPAGVDVDRILSCVNACEGMEDPAAEIAELKQQRDELLGLVKAVVYHSVPVTVNGIRCAAFPWVEYEAMVNNAKGGEK